MGLALFCSAPHPLSPSRERTERVLDRQESSDPDRVSGPTTDQLPGCSGSGRMSDLRQNSCVMFPSGWPQVWLLR